jgi:hypothetical protein
MIAISAGESPFSFSVPVSPTNLPLGIASKVPLFFSFIGISLCSLLSDDHPWKMFFLNGDRLSLQIFSQIWL